MGSRLPVTRVRVADADMARALLAACRSRGIADAAVPILMAQSWRETGFQLECNSFGYVKASGTWGGDFFYREATENLPAAALIEARRNQAMRTDGRSGLGGIPGPNMVEGRTAGGLTFCRFFPDHPLARFRGYLTLELGADGWLDKLAGTRYRAALALAEAGDASGYIAAVRAAGYFTEPLDSYRRGYDEAVPRMRAVVADVRREDALAWGEAVGAPPTSVLASSGDTMQDRDVFVTDPADLAVHSSGWFRLASGAEMTRLPLIDASVLRLLPTSDGQQIFARVGHGVQLPNGWRLPTVAEYEELHALALYIDPYTMPTAEQLAADGIPRTTAAIDAYRNARMRSRRWCETHDAEVFRRIAKAALPGPAKGRIQDPSTFHLREPGYTDYGTTIHGARPGTGGELGNAAVIANAGKHWAAVGIIVGWWQHGPAIPTGSPAPQGDHPTLRLTSPYQRGEAVARVQGALGIVPSDGIYGPATVLIVRSWQAASGLTVDGVFGPASWAVLELDGAQDAPGEAPAPAPAALPLGERALAVARAEQAAGVREVPGGAAHPRILEYFKGCERDGQIIGSALRSDEEAWCAASASWCLAQALQPGEVWPHRWRASVRELWADAVAGGIAVPARRIRSGELVPNVGDLWIGTRGGYAAGPEAYPFALSGGRGHVGRIASLASSSSGGAIVTLDGNINNQWWLVSRAANAPEFVGVIRYPR